MRWIQDQQKTCPGALPFEVKKISSADLSSIHSDNGRSDIDFAGTHATAEVAAVETIQFCPACMASDLARCRKHACMFAYDGDEESCWFCEAEEEIRRKKNWRKRFSLRTMVSVFDVEALLGRRCSWNADGSMAKEQVGKY